MPHPIRSLKSFIAARVVLAAWHKFIKRHPEMAGDARFLMEFMRGKKELFTLALGFIATLMTTLGLAEWAPLFGKLQAAVQAGDTTAILGAIFGLFLFAAAFFRRLGQNRKSAAMAGKLEPGEKDKPLPVK